MYVRMFECVYYKGLHSVQNACRQLRRWMKSRRLRQPPNTATAPARRLRLCNRRSGKGGGAEVEEKDGKAASISRQRAVPSPPLPCLLPPPPRAPSSRALPWSPWSKHFVIEFSAGSSRPPEGPCAFTCLSTLSNASAACITPERGGTRLYFHIILSRVLYSLTALNKTFIRRGWEWQL